MKLNIASPPTGTQKLIDFEDEQKIRHLYDKHLGTEFAGDILGEEFKGYIFKITGGCDKDGFPMKQGILVNSRVRLLLARGSLGFQAWRGRRGERLRNTLRGCIIGPDIAVLSVTIVRKGPSPIPDLTDKENPRRLGHKRASKLRKLFSLGAKSDLRQVVMKKKISKRAASEGKKARGAKTRCPKIQRLVTPVVLHRRKVKKATLTARREKAHELREHYQKRLRRLMTVAWQVKMQRKKKSHLKTLKAFDAAVRKEKPSQPKPAPAPKPKGKK